jgi:hypothetical protein
MPRGHARTAALLEPVIPEACPSSGERGLPCSGDLSGGVDDGHGVSRGRPTEEPAGGRTPRRGVPADQTPASGPGEAAFNQENL